jgi:hypothetical protein
MTDLRRLSHTGDPETSTTAALKLDAEGRQSLKEALITLLDEKPRTGDELTAAYFHQAEFRHWPQFSDRHNVKRRLSELHATHHVIRESGTTRESLLGKQATVWELSVPVDEARVIVAMRRAA